jgi:hypothetical protein
VTELEEHIEFNINELEKRIAELRNYATNTKRFRADANLSAGSGAKNMAVTAKLVVEAIQERLIPALNIYETLVGIEDEKKKQAR